MEGGSREVYSRVPTHEPQRRRRPASREVQEPGGRFTHKDLFFTSLHPPEIGDQPVDHVAQSVHLHHAPQPLFLFVDQLLQAAKGEEEEEEEGRGGGGRGGEEGREMRGGGFKRASEE